MSFAISQAIETQRGLVPAGEIVPSDRVRGWHDGTWNTVDAVSFGEDEIVRVEVNGEIILVGSDARFISGLLPSPFSDYNLHVTPVGTTHRMLGADGSRYLPQSIEKIGAGKCVNLRLAEAEKFVAEMKKTGTIKFLSQQLRPYLESRCIRIGKFVAWN